MPAASTTETFVALKLYLDNWRWADVPFFLRTGKSMKRRETHISIQFRQPPLMLFRDTPVEQLQPNRLVIHIQPDEAITLSFGAKIPGPQLRLGTVDMRFAYKDYFGERPSTGTSVCSTTAWRETRRYSSARTWWRRDGRWSRRSSMSGRRCRRETFPTTPLARGDRRKPTS